MCTLFWIFRGLEQTVCWRGARNVNGHLTNLLHGFPKLVFGLDLSNFSLSEMGEYWENLSIWQASFYFSQFASRSFTIELWWTLLSTCSKVGGTLLQGISFAKLHLGLELLKNGPRALWKIAFGIGAPENWSTCTSLFLAIECRMHFSSSWIFQTVWTFQKIMHTNIPSHQIISNAHGNVDSWFNPVMCDEWYFKIIFTKCD